MAKPSEGSLRDFYKLNEGDVTTNGKSFIDSTLDKIANKTSKDLLVGTVTGWITGFTVVKVGKVAAFGLGGGILLLHFASESGYIHVNWERVREATEYSQNCVEDIMLFIKRNSCYSVGFLGGFFFGVASA